jgi:hypothetical protein
VMIPAVCPDSLPRLTVRQRRVGPGGTLPVQHG